MPGGTRARGRGRATRPSASTAPGVIGTRRHLSRLPSTRDGGARRGRRRRCAARRPRPPAGRCRRAARARRRRGRADAAGRRRSRPGVCRAVASSSSWRSTRGSRLARAGARRPMVGSAGMSPRRWQPGEVAPQGGDPAGDGGAGVAAGAEMGDVPAQEPSIDDGRGRRCRPARRRRRTPATSAGTRVRWRARHR